MVMDRNGGTRWLYIFKTAKPIDWTFPDKNSHAMYDTVCGGAVDPG